LVTALNHFSVREAEYISTEDYMNRKLRRTAKPISLSIAILALFAACDIFIFLPGWLDDSTDLSIELTWDGSQDLDLYVTVPAPSDGNTTNNAGTPPYTNILQAYDQAAISGGDPGFTPKDGTSQRERIFSGNTSDSFSGDTVVYNSGASDSDTQVIEIRGIPFNYNTGGFTTAANSENGLTAGYDYAWVGIMEVYVWATSGKVSDADNVQVTVYQGSNTVGTYVIPEDTNVTGASLVRIPVFRARNTSTSAERNTYQILAHTQLLTSQSQIRGIEEPQVVGEYQVLNVFGTQDQ